MREAAFKKWLQEQGYDEATVSTQVARVNRLARAYGDLDALHASKGLEQLQRELAYSKDDERAGKGNPAAFPIDGNLYNGLASVRKSIDYYRQFLEADGGPSNRRAHMGLIARLSAADIEATMDDCDAVGVDDFLRSHGYVRPSNWVTRPTNDQRYPAKAIVGIAVGKLAGASSLRADEYFGGFGESQSYARLKELGYTIVGKGEVGMAENQLAKPAVEAAMDEYDSLGQARFLAKYERGLQGTRYWVRRKETLYPSKAIANAAFEIQHGERGSYGGSEARRQLSGLGYTITNRDGGAVSGGVESATLEPAPAAPTNLILYGPPGTGKTYATASEAVRLCGEPVPVDRNDLMAAYRRLSDAGRIEFVTFHQSIAYEDFVEGLRPTQASEDGAAGFELKPEQGVFRRISRRAETSTGPGDAAFSISGRGVFKMSIGEAANPDDAHLFEEAIAGGYALLGFEDIDWSDDRFADRREIIEEVRARGVMEGGEPTAQSGRVQMPFIFRNWMKPGDIVVVSKGNSLFRAIGEVTGDYQFVPREGGDYGHRRAVRWLWVDRAGVPVSEIYTRRFSMRSVYQLTDADLNVPALERYIASQQHTGTGTPESFVLIIDEINRANISKVFGELITLLEPDKRIGQANALKVRLPYSGDLFGVPSNLHIIGTMNTADRSIALLDTALRRRFEFRELMPDASLLGVVDGIELSGLLSTINERIEYLFDREHQIGHAYLMGCESRADVDEVMRHKIIPLLAEYFYEDWGKVAAVLGDGDDGENNREGRFIDRRRLKAPKSMGGDEDSAPRYRWSVRETFSYEGFAAG